MVIIITFYFDIYQIHFSNNNPNDEEKITSHLMCYNCFMIKMLQLLCYNFFMTEISCLRGKKNNNREALAKHVT